MASVNGAGTIVGKVGVRVVPVTDNFRRDLERDLRRQLGGLDDIGKNFGESFGSSLGDAAGKQANKSLQKAFNKTPAFKLNVDDRVMRQKIDRLQGYARKPIKVNIEANQKGLRNAEKNLKRLNRMARNTTRDATPGITRKLRVQARTKDLINNDRGNGSSPFLNRKPALSEFPGTGAKARAKAAKEWDNQIKAAVDAAKKAQDAFRNTLNPSIFLNAKNRGTDPLADADLSGISKLLDQHEKLNRIKDQIARTTKRQVDLQREESDLAERAGRLEELRGKRLQLRQKQYLQYLQYLRIQKALQTARNIGNGAAKVADPALNIAGRGARGVGRGAANFSRKNFGEFPGVGQAIAGELLINKLAQTGKSVANLRRQFIQLGGVIATSFAAGAVGANLLAQGLGAAIGYAPGLLLVGLGLKAIAKDADVKAAATGLSDAFKQSAMEMKPGVLDALGSIKSAVVDNQGVFDKFYQKSGNGIRSLGEAAAKVVRSDSFSQLMDKWGTRTESLFGKVAGGLPGFVDAWNKVDDKLFTGANGNDSVMTRLKKAMGGIGSGISADGINQGIERFTQAMERAAPGIQSFRKNFGTMFDAFQAQLDTMATTIGQTGPRLFDSIGQIGTQAITTGGQILNSAIQASDVALAASRTSITTFLSTLGTETAGALQTLAPVMGSVVSQISDLGTNVAPALGLVATALANLEPAATGVFDNLNAAVDGLKNSGLGEAIDNFTSQFGEKVGGALSSIAPDVEHFATAAGNLAASAIGRVAGDLDGLAGAIKGLGTALDGIASVIDTLNSLNDFSTTPKSDDGFGEKLLKNVLSFGGYSDAEIQAAAEKQKANSDANKETSFPVGGTPAPGSKPGSTKSSEITQNAPAAGDGWWTQDGASGNMTWHSTDGSIPPQDKWPAVPTGTPAAAGTAPGTDPATAQLGKTLGIPDPDKTAKEHTAASSQQINTVTPEDIANAQTFAGIMTQVNDLGGKFNEARGQLEQSVSGINQSISTMQQSMTTASDAVTTFGDGFVDAGQNMSGLNIPLSVIQGTMSNFASSASTAATQAGAIGERAQGSVGGVNGLKDAIANIVPPTNWGAITQAFDNIGNSASTAAGQVVALRDAINSLTDKTVTVTYNQVGSPSGGDGAVSPTTGFPTPRASGGWIRGAGTTTSDSIPALLSNKEFVVNAKAASSLGSNTMNYLNKTGKLPGFADGGEVGKTRTAKQQEAYDKAKAAADAKTIANGYTPKSADTADSSSSSSGSGQDAGSKFASIGLDFIKANVDQFLTDIGWSGDGIVSTLYDQAWEQIKGGGSSGGGSSSSSSKTDKNGDNVTYVVNDLQDAQRKERVRSNRKSLQYNQR